MGYHLALVEVASRKPCVLADPQALLMERAQEVLALAENISAAFISVGSPEYNYSVTDAYEGLPDLMNILSNMISEYGQKCVGDILLCLIDESGQRVGSDFDIRANEAVVFSIGLQRLHRIVASGGVVSILASRPGKAKAIHGALTAGLANSLVIDKTV